MPEVTPSKYVLYAGWSSAPHLDEQTKADLLASFPPHEREARSRGEPALGSGAIYPVAESEIICDPFAIPPYWPRVFGLDVGWKRTAAVWLAYDRSTDCVYAYTEHYRGEAEPSVHASAIKARGEWIPGVIDPAARGRQQADGKQLLSMYTQLGLDLSLADNSVEAGIYSVWERLSTGRLKIFSTLQNLRAEYRQYHRDENGKVVKEHDHACLHPETRVLTRQGAMRIADMVGTEGEVLSINGEWQPYHSCQMTAQDQNVMNVEFEDGSVVTCTPDHLFYTQDGWVEAISLTGRDCYNVVSQRNGYGEPCKSTSYLTRPRSFAARAITSAGFIFREMVSACIGWCGKRSMVAQSPMAGTSITSTMTAATTSPKTWRWFLSRSISRIISAAMIAVSQMKLSPLLASGISPMPAGAGMPSIMSGSRTVFTHVSSSYAQSVERHSKQGERVIAPTSVSQRHVGALASIMSSASAMPAAVRSPSTSTAKPGRAVASAVVRCKAVRSSGRSDVYCLTVPATAAFAVENGVIVHNCDALRYGIMSGLARAQVEPAKTTPQAVAFGDSIAGY